MSSSKSSTSTSQSTTNNVNETNLQDTGGITVNDASGTHIVVNQTDQGAVAAGQELGQSAINAAANAASDAIGAGVNQTNSIVDLLQDISSQLTGVANAGLDNAAAAEQSGLTFGNDALATVQDIVSQTQAQQEQLVGDALSGYQTIAQQNSASSATQIQKVALYLIIAVAIILVVPKVFK